MNIARLTFTFALFACLAFPIGWTADSMSNAAISIPFAAPAGCKCNSCKKRRKICRRCPKCQHDFCTLKCENEKVNKKCFDVDQKIVCIPKVTWPWQKCPPKCAKTKTVNVLKTKKYQCCQCKYSWDICEPELPKTIQQLNDEQAQQIQQPTPTQQRHESILDDPAQPPFEQNQEQTQLYDPSGSDVPTPPVYRQQQSGSTISP